MKKITLITLILVFFLTACESYKIIPEGITLIDESEVPVREGYVCILKERTTFDTLIDKSSHIVKLVVNEVIYFQYEASYTYNDYLNTWEQLGIAYDITIEEVLYGTNIKKNKNYYLYLPFMEEYSDPPLIFPEVGEEYYAFLMELDNNNSKALLEFIDYTFKDNEIGIVPVSVANEKRLLTTIENFTNK
ncbi:MAG: hypothetical protein KAG94_02220 [Clostridiales bacterium]|nr:hypothetical protein [Clostridiales bacterium]